MKSILVLHGINLNMFGKRDPKQYGTITLKEIDAKIAALGTELGVKVECFQTNHEGEMAEKIHKALEEQVDAVVINAGAWLLVVIILEVEVRLQLRGDLSDRVMSTTKILKLLVYGALFVAAGYWGFAGDFLDFWDAALWLFAFIFIELNVFEWQYETTRNTPSNA